MTTPKEALERLRDYLRGEAKKTDTCYTCYTDQAAFIATRLSTILASLQGEDAVERVARIINPGAWRYVDDATRPYAENRGSSSGNGGEKYWYERTYRAGCRSVSDVKKWLFERTLTPDDPLNITRIRESIAKARAILATGLVAGEAEIRADERPYCDPTAQGEAFYLAMYRKDGAIWDANEHKEVWINKARDYERRRAAAIRSGGGE